MCLLTYLLMLVISTHTPTRGVTLGFGHFVVNVIISTHTPTRGVTAIHYYYHELFQFQLTRPRGA